VIWGGVGLRRPTVGPDAKWASETCRGSSMRPELSLVHAIWCTND
jgi:hypothetical protein